MATRFDAKDYSKKRLLSICTKFIPEEYFNISSGRKGFRLSEKTVAIIKVTEEVINEAMISGETIPTSTTNLYRYGTVCLNIFDDLSQYQTLTSLKTRSRRGYRKELEVIDYNTKKIELEFKKSSNPPVKIQKDEKLIKALKGEYLILLNQDDTESLLPQLTKKEKIFVLEHSDGKKFHQSLSRLITTLDDLKLRKTSDISKLESTKATKSKTLTKIKKIRDQLPELNSQIAKLREDHKLTIALSEKEKLLSDSELSLLLRIITTSLDRYIRMIERKENRTIEERDQLLGMVIDPTRFSGFDEKLWRQIVFIIETHGIELLGNKPWFEFTDSDSLRSFITSKDVLEKLAKIRGLESKIYKIEEELKKIPEYIKTETLIEEFNEMENLLPNLETQIQELEEAIKTSTTEYDINKEKAIVMLS